MTARTAVRVRIATDAGERQRAADEWLAAVARDGAAGDLRLALVVEGALAAPRVPAGTEVRLLAAGCVCCVGQLPLRVMLTRLLRGRPQHVLLLLAHGEHRAGIRKMLQEAPFAPILSLVETIDEDPARQRH